MQSKSRRSPLKSFFLALVFLSPLLGVAVVRRSGGVSEEPLFGRSQSRAEAVRAHQPSAEARASQAGAIQYRLVVQFSHGAQIRARADGRLESLSGRRTDELQALAKQLGVRFSPLVRLPAKGMQELEQRAALGADSAPLDFLGMHIANLPALDLARMESIATQLQADPLVQLAHIQTLGCQPPDDPAPATPDYSAFQGYLSSGVGIDALFAHNRGYRGAGVRVSDCEFGWNAEHEELHHVNLHAESGQTPHPSVAFYNYDAHGTAVAGIIKGQHDSHGVNGVAPDCELYTFPEWTVEAGFRRVESILSAVAFSAPGDVVLLEMQTVGPGGGFGPAEIDPLVWSVVRAASDAGVIVVAAAGNGAEDLDSAGYQSYRDRGNSGAILVGAGSSNGQHYRLGFSSFGQRVDVQAWGQSVFTSGYGIYAELGGDKNQRYTSVFSGTSSAAALVAGVVAVLQSAQLASSGQIMDAAAMRQLLVTSGAPQSSGAHIGPAPQLREALESLPFVGRVLTHNGSGKNPNVLGSPGVPRLGQTWRVSIDTSSSPAASGSALFFSMWGSQGVMTPYGELLLNLASPPLAVFRATPVGGQAVYVLQMPSDPKLIGVSVHAQGVLFSGQVQLTNSLEARLGH